VAPTVAPTPPAAPTPAPPVDRDASPTYSPQPDVPGPVSLTPPAVQAVPASDPVVAPVSDPADSPPEPASTAPVAPRVATPAPAPAAPARAAEATHATIAPVMDFGPDSSSDWLGDDPGPAPDPIPGVFDEPLITFGGVADGDLAFERELEAMAARRARSTRLAVAGLGALLLMVLACGGTYTAYLSVIGGDGMAVTRPEPTPKPSAEEGAEVPEPAPASAAVPEPTEAPVPEPEVAPAPGAAPKPGPAAPEAPTPKPAPAPSAGGGSVSKFCKQGWNAVDSNPQKAAAAFGKALALEPTNGEASYGMGIALLRLKRSDEAKTHLCLAVRTGSAGDAREAKSVLEQNGLSCN
jgi:hypothetical protein